MEKQYKLVVARGYGKANGYPYFYEKGKATRRKIVRYKQKYYSYITGLHFRQAWDILKFGDTKEVI